MVDLILDPMSPSEYEAFKEETVREYAEENVSAGYWHSSDAVKRSMEVHQRLLPDGVATEGHYLFIARDARSGEAVGYIWLSVDENAVIPSGFIFALSIHEKFRRRGYGTMMMRAIEAKASELGLRRLMLHVFAQNPVAVHMYEKAGYCVTSLNMMKEVHPR